jgi:hypothetical protein
MMVKYRLGWIILISVFLTSCAVNHPYARSRPKPGKKKSCNCPDFGLNSIKNKSNWYFYPKISDQRIQDI